MTSIAELGYPAAMESAGVIVIGAGIAGASIAAHLAATQRVVLAEMEDRPGYHTTGRSAATYEPNYGPAPMLAFTRASESFFKTPPQGFADAPLLVPRMSLFLEAEGQSSMTTKLLSASSGLDEISAYELHKLMPVIRQGYARRSFLDRATGDLDVDLLHRGYLRLLKERGGQVLLSSPVTHLAHHNGGWRATAGIHQITAPIVVNAAGAWADKVAQMAGLAPVGLVPKRRSIGVVPLNTQLDFSQWPMAADVGETWYAKPQSGKYIVSSADATPVEPHDAYADDLAIATGIERFMNATTLEIDRLDHSWGGLRVFAPDGCPVVGFSRQAPGFFWLAGQGGYGIQSCPALSETAARMVLGQDPPDHVMGHGLNIQHITPERFAA